MGFLDIFKKKEPEKQGQSATEPAVADLIEADTPNNLKLGYTKDGAGNWAGFYLPEEDRSTHLYVLGSSGVGKSKGLANWVLEDINHGRGCGVIDLHGDLVNDIDLLFYQRGDKTFQTRVADPSGHKKYLVVAPDAFFGLKTNQGRHYFFVEVDMGTETLKRFAEKIIAYKQYWKSGKYTETYGFKHFRVLTIAESEKRLVNLIDTTAKAGGRSMFLFTTFAGIEKSILGEVWFSPVSHEPRYLLG